jgi:ABC-type phosphate transport system substrate-binding protein
MYPSEKSLADKPQVKAFMDFTLENQQTIAEASQIVPLTAAQVEKGKSTLGG